MNARPTNAGPERISGFVARFAQLLDAHVRNVADELGITPGQAVALRELDEPMTLSELAIRMACARPNATYVADRMEAQELIERRPHPHDRRAKVVVLTAAGKDCRANVLRALAVNSPIAELTASDKEELTTVLSRVLEQRTPEPDDSAPSSPALGLMAGP